MILSILRNLLKPIVSTNVQTILGLYVYKGGAQRRVVDTLSQLEISMSYKTLQRRTVGLTEEARRRIRVVGRIPTSIVTYDNFDFAEAQRRERIGDVGTFRSLTTALLFEPQKIDEDFPWSATMPSVKQLPPYRTRVYPVAPVMVDESKTANNISILNHIFSMQIGVDEDDPQFTELFRFVQGDLKTFKRIEAVKNLRSGVSQRLFDTFDWFLLGMGPWHP
ncbi:MAG: hypothetical protein Q9182_006685 [Xanthomendoza sp. 2 TL-2023]